MNFTTIVVYEADTEIAANQVALHTAQYGSPIAGIGRPTFVYATGEALVEALHQAAEAANANDAAEFIRVFQGEDIAYTVPQS